MINSRNQRNSSRSWSVGSRSLRSRNHSNARLAPEPCSITISSALVQTPRRRSCCGRLKGWLRGGHDSLVQASYHHRLSVTEENRESRIDRERFGQRPRRSEEHTSELQSQSNLVC